MPDKEEELFGSCTFASLDYAKSSRCVPKSNELSVKVMTESWDTNKNEITIYTVEWSFDLISDSWCRLKLLRPSSLIHPQKEPGTQEEFLASSVTLSAPSSRKRRAGKPYAEPERLHFKNVTPMKNSCFSVKLLVPSSRGSRCQKPIPVHHSRSQKARHHFL